MKWVMKYHYFKNRRPVHGGALMTWPLFAMAAGAPSTARAEAPRWLGFAVWTRRVKPAVLAFWHVIEDRTLALLVAVCTYVMRRFTVAHGLLQRVHQRSSNRGCQLAALLLCLPCFHANNLAFKIAYTINQRRLSRI